MKKRAVLQDSKSKWAEKFEKLYIYTYQEDFLIPIYIRLPPFIKVGKRGFCPLFSLHNVAGVYMSCVRFCVRKIDCSAIDNKPNHYPHKVVIRLFLCLRMEIYKENFK